MRRIGPADAGMNRRETARPRLALKAAPRTRGETAKPARTVVEHDGNRTVAGKNEGGATCRPTSRATGCATPPPAR